MFGAAIIVLRESLEAALIVGIVAAATRAIPGRGRWLGAGIASGLAGAILIALFTRQIADWADGLGQEMFNAAVLAFAVAMLAWHNIWMSSHARELARNAKGVANAVTEGSRSLAAVTLVIALAVLREGSETVLFLYGTLATGNDVPGVAIGGTAGLAAGIVAGYAMYAGLVRIPLRWFFNVTALLILLFAAGMSGQMARLLIQADVLPPLMSPLWDASPIVSNESAVGTFLRALVGYEARPAGMQVLFYAATLTATLAGMWIFRIPQSTRDARS